MIIKVYSWGFVFIWRVRHLYGHGIYLTFYHTFILFTNTRIMVWRFLHVSKSTIVSSNTAQNLAMSQGIAYQRRQSKNITNSFVDKTKLCTINYCKEVWLYQIFFSCFALFKQGIQIDIITRIGVIAKINDLEIILSQQTYYRNKTTWVLIFLYIILHTNF